LGTRDRTTKRLTGSSEAGHHRSDRDVQRVGQFLIGQLVDLAQDKQRTNTFGQTHHRELDRGKGVRPQQERFGIQA
jgi:hypothetical protein